MVGMKSRCHFENCRTWAYFNLPGSQRGMFCARHKSEGMVDVVNRLCAAEGCSKHPNFNHQDQTMAIFCSQHKEPGMVNVNIRDRQCAMPDCSKYPSCNFPGSADGLYCGKHKHPGMVNVTSRHCAAPGCIRQPNFHHAGNSRGLFCCEHKQEGMVNVVSKPCEHEGCNKQPSFNLPDSTQGLFCATHRQPGMVNVKQKRCVHEGCNNRPSFNHPGENSGVFCSAHKEEGMVDVRNRHCEEPNCIKCPSFNYPGQKPGIFCGQHKRPGMMDVKHKRGRGNVANATLGPPVEDNPVFPGTVNEQALAASVVAAMGNMDQATLLNVLGQPDLLAQALAAAAQGAALPAGGPTDAGMTQLQVANSLEAARLAVLAEADAEEASTLVLAEHKDARLVPATLSTVMAAAQLGAPVSLLVSGHGLDTVVSSARSIQDVGQVLVADDASLAHSLPEPAAALLAELQRRRGFTHVLAPSSSFGRDVLPRAAALLGAQPASDAVAVVDADTIVRPFYAGNAMQTVRFAADGPRMFTIRPTAFPAAAGDGGAAAPVEAVSTEELSAAQAWHGDGARSVWVGEEMSRSERPDLGAAKVVVAGGRGLKSADNFRLLDSIAAMLGGAIGASRAAVDAGFVPNDLQVGQTGKVVAPDLYIAVGISGAIQHLAGMKDSKCIVAINTDADAPIFQVADYGLVADLFVALPELEAALRQLKEKA
ncbi:hypothetical protein WJX81_003124 [Elliptochloris bilobata]|uniref:Electron transfer flavoprotein alpha/beta-subunit N-terminal domain-containing protein n=1 Tax=Elliptochloris bilobata TaxID=381761 RepID=A0AAW1SAH7_9CHLO